MDAPAATALNAKDFTTDQEVRWCPGCGDYAILKAVQRALAEIGTPPEKVVFVSGIGCSSRFPYYVNTYGFHTIHGRAAAVATGVKLANPDLDVWIVSGDGDSLSIGGNHLLHLLRRNLDVQYLLFNNEIYGLTKGQYSPTSRRGTRSPSSPSGSVEQPITAASFALGAGGRFVARTIDTDQKNMPAILMRAHAHKGTSFVEILQNCSVYNDDVFAEVTDKAGAAEHQIATVHGAPLIFGKDRDRGLRVKANGLGLEVVRIGENGVGEADILIHDETNRTLAGLLAEMSPPDFPTAVGVLYCDPAETYETSVAAQLRTAAEADPDADLDTLLHRGATWKVED